MFITGVRLVRARFHRFSLLVEACCHALRRIIGLMPRGLVGFLFPRINQAHHIRDTLDH